MVGVGCPVRIEVSGVRERDGIVAGAVAVAVDRDRQEVRVISVPTGPAVGATVSGYPARDWGHRYRQQRARGCGATRCRRGVQTTVSRRRALTRPERPRRTGDEEEGDPEGRASPAPSPVCLPLDGRQWSA